MPTTEAAERLGAEELAILLKISRGGYVFIPDSLYRRRLARRGLIERWNPILKATSRLKPYRLTDAGRAALGGQHGS